VSIDRALQYMDGIVQNVLLSRRCAMVACKKLQQLYMDHDDSNIAGIQTPGGNRYCSCIITPLSHLMYIQSTQSCAVLSRLPQLRFPSPVGALSQRHGAHDHARLSRRARVELLELQRGEVRALVRLALGCAPLRPVHAAHGAWTRSRKCMFLLLIFANIFYIKCYTCSAQTRASSP
jgi:hypothetical protein